MVKEELEENIPDSEPVEENKEETNNNLEEKRMSDNLKDLGELMITSLDFSGSKENRNDTNS